MAAGSSDGVPGISGGSAQIVPFVQRRLHMPPGNLFQRIDPYRLAQNLSWLKKFRCTNYIT